MRNGDRLDVVVPHFLDFLCTHEVGRAASVSRGWQRGAASDRVWRRSAVRSREDTRRDVERRSARCVLCDEGDLDARRRGALLQACRCEQVWHRRCLDRARRQGRHGLAPFRCRTCGAALALESKLTGLRVGWPRARVACEDAGVTLAASAVAAGLLLLLAGWAAGDVQRYELDAWGGTGVCSDTDDCNPYLAVECRDPRSMGVSSFESPRVDAAARGRSAQPLPLDAPARCIAPAVEDEPLATLRVYHDIPLRPDTLLGEASVPLDFAALDCEAEASAWEAQADVATHCSAEPLALALEPAPAGEVGVRLSVVPQSRVQAAWMGLCIVARVIEMLIVLMLILVAILSIFGGGGGGGGGGGHPTGLLDSHPGSLPVIGLLVLALLFAVAVAYFYAWLNDQSTKKAVSRWRVRDAGHLGWRGCGACEGPC